jgi:hypothetical protein
MGEGACLQNSNTIQVKPMGFSGLRFLACFPHFDAAVWLCQSGQRCAHLCPQGRYPDFIFAVKVNFAVSSIGVCQCKFDESNIWICLGGSGMGIHFVFARKTVNI